MDGSYDRDFVQWSEADKLRRLRTGGGVNSRR